MSEKDVRMERQTMLIILLVVVAVLLTVMWLFYVHDQRIKIQNRLLQMRMTIMRNRISPHFVFNVLNNEMETADDEQQKLLSKLAQLIRENLDLSLQDYIPLVDDLIHTTSTGGGNPAEGGTYHLVPDKNTGLYVTYDSIELDRTNYIVSVNGLKVCKQVGNTAIYELKNTSGTSIPLGLIS